jgi:ribose/xylose/arabinose/galactoside ABC-type transport system permease subunit
MKEFLKIFFTRLLINEDNKKVSVEAGATGLILMLCIVASITDGSFLSGRNFLLILDSVTLYLLMALGLTFVLLSGSVNLSVGGMLSLNCVIFAMVSNSMGLLWSIPAVLLCGFLEGVATGYVFKIFRIPSFIATYGMMGLYTSFGVVLCGGTPIVLKMDVMRSLRVLNYMVFPGIKLQYLLAAIAFAIFMFVQKRTSFGKFVTAIGNSPEASRHIGINIDFIKIMSYGLSGFSTAIGSIVLCARLYSGDPTVGTAYLLLIVAVVIVGGTSLSGGTGGILNTLLGALTISIIQDVLQIMGVNIYYHSVFIGLVMIIAVAISLDKKRVLIVK